MSLGKWRCTTAARPRAVCATRVTPDDAWYVVLVLPSQRTQRRSVLLGRTRRLHPSYLSDSARARAVRRARMVMRPAIAAARTPVP